MFSADSRHRRVFNALLLIHPPVAKPGEPPAGLARLAFALKSGGVAGSVWDASLEGLLDLLDRPAAAKDTWSRRAAAHVRENLAALKTPAVYENRDQYQRAVRDINRVLHNAGQAAGCRVSLADYTDPELSPLRCKDLLQAAARYEKNVFYPFFKTRLPNLVSVVNPAVIGFSVNFMSQALCAFAMAGFIRQRWPNIRMVFGGGLVTSWAHIPGFANPFHPLVTELVDGPGEEALVSMLGGDSAAAASSAGFDYAGFDLDAYLSPRRVLPYAASRGCYWRKCRFCPEKYENTPYQAFDKKSRQDSLDRVCRQYRPGLVHFVDNALPPAFLKDMSANPPGVPWYGFVRITPDLADPDFVAGLRRSGCVMLKLGIESGDQGVLDSLNKGISLETVSRALKTVKAAGIAVYAYLLFGTPAESLASARKTLSFTLSHAECIDFLNLAIFNLPALSRDAPTLQTSEFYPGELSLYRQFIHPLGWHRNRVRRFLEKEFKRTPPIRALLRNDPPFFTSNHAPFFAGRAGWAQKKF